MRQHATALPDDADVLAEDAWHMLRVALDQGVRLACAESCTGGLLSSLLTDVEGCGRAFERGFVTYSEEAKCEMLGIDPMLIAQYGAVSREVAIAMARGAIENSHADFAVSITGFAGPDEEHEEGLVHLALCGRGGDRFRRLPIHREHHFGARGRDEVRLMAARSTIEMLTRALTGREEAA